MKWAQGMDEESWGSVRASRGVWVRSQQGRLRQGYGRRPWGVGEEWCWGRSDRGGGEGVTEKLREGDTVRG